MRELNRDLQRKVTRATFATRAFVVVGIVTVAGIILTQLWLAYAVRQTQQEGSPLGKKMIRVIESSSVTQATISDCVTPGGKCFERSRKNQADVVATLNLGTLYALSCDRNNPGATIQQLQACVTDLYQRGQQ